MWRVVAGGGGGGAGGHDGMYTISPTFIHVHTAPHTHTHTHVGRKYDEFNEFYSQMYE